jgi:hypothetical protein
MDWQLCRNASRIAGSCSAVTCCDVVYAAGVMRGHDPGIDPLSGPNEPRDDA